MTVLLAPQAQTNYRGLTGTQYTSNARRQITVTDADDIEQLLRAGCEYETPAGVQTGDVATFAGVKLTGVAVASLGSAATAGAGAVKYCTNGDAGAKCLVLSDGTNWKVVSTLGATASAS